MADEKLAGASPFDSAAGPDVGQAVLGKVSVASKGSVDPSAFKDLNTEFTKLNTQVREFKTALPKLISDTKAWAAALGTVATNMKKVSTAQSKGGGGGSYLPDAGMLVGSGNTIDQRQIANITVNQYGAGGAKGAGGGGDEGKGLGKFGTFLDYANSLLGPLSQSLDERIARGASYSLSADRMNMLYQQMSGMTQNQAYHAFRAPLKDKLLGMGGVNAILGLQATTGINAGMQAKSAEALRAVSGFGYSTSDINAMTQQMASPGSLNNMFMMLGTGIYGIGGKQRSTQQVFQDIISRTGLTNERVVNAAFQQGSMVRARLAMSGVSGEQQDLLLQYAKQNIAYQRKGGRGFYDPSQAAQRKLMGVEEDQYATQFEKTQASAVSREENFYKRQNDNFAQMEKNLQAVNKALEAFEEKLSGLIGARISSKGSMLKGAAKWAISGMIGIGAGILTGGTGGFAATMGTKGVLDAIWGDGPTGSSRFKSYSPSNPVTGDPVGGSVPENVRKSEPALAKLNPRFAERLRKMLMANSRLYIGGGQRENTKEEFLRRYKLASPNDPQNETDQTFNGQRYVLRPGMVAYAPPGHSMHEIGLAADMAPASEFDWITKHAREFGLQNFADYGGESWHVQPADLPRSRSDYEEQGAPWGLNGAAPMSAGGASGTKSFMQGNTTSSTTTGFGWSSQSMSEIIGATNLNSNSSPRTKSYTPGKSPTSTSVADGPNPIPIAAGVLSGPQVAQHMYNAGFRGSDLQRAVATAWRESNFNPMAHNTKSPDDSYGLMQINMNDNAVPGYMNAGMGKDRAKKFGISRYDELFNPAVNANSAYILFSGKGKNGTIPGAGWSPWGPSSALKQEYLDNAKNYIKDAKLPSGDPPAPARQQVSSVGAGASYNITVSPSITVHTQNGGNLDLQKMARDVAALLEREVKLTMLRIS